MFSFADCLSRLSRMWPDQIRVGEEITEESPQRLVSVLYLIVVEDEIKFHLQLAFFIQML